MKMNLDTYEDELRGKARLILSHVALNSSHSFFTFFKFALYYKVYLKKMRWREPETSE